MGQDLYRYEVNAGLEGSDRFTTSLSIFLIDKP